METNTQSTPKTKLYTLKKVRELYAEATGGKKLPNNTLANMIEDGAVRKLTPKGKRARGFYYQEDIDTWIEELKALYDQYEVIA